MRRYFVLLALILALGVTGSQAKAAEVSSGDMITIEKQQKNPLIFSNFAKIKSDTKGDLTIFAGEIEVNNSVENSAYLFGAKASVKSPEIGNRLVIGAGDVTIASHIKGDLIMFGGNVSLESPSIIDGDVYVYGGNLYLRGQVAGNVKAGAGKIILEGFIAEKDVELISDQISSDDNSKIKGKLSYFADKELQFPESLVSNPSFNKIQKDVLNSNSSIIGGLMMLMLFGALVAWVQRKTITNLITQAQEKFSATLLTGLVATVVTPIIILILALTYVGIFSAFALGLLYILAWIFAYAYASIFAGSVLIKWITKSKQLRVDYLAAIVGAMIIGLLNFVPFVGPIVIFVICLVGLGIAYSSLKLMTK